ASLSAPGPRGSGEARPAWGHAYKEGASRFLSAGVSLTRLPRRSHAHDGREALREGGPHHPDAVGGRRGEGELRPPRHADGARADRARDLARPPALRPGRSSLARSRPVRALVRARVDAALLDAAPRRLRSAARRAQAVPAVGLEDAGAPRGAPHARG